MNAGDTLQIWNKGWMGGAIWIWSPLQVVILMSILIGIILLTMKLSKR